jgi:hypothetical protein
VKLWNPPNFIGLSSIPVEIDPMLVSLTSGRYAASGEEFIRPRDADFCII